MKKLLIFLLLLLVYAESNSGVIYVCKEKYKADIKVYITNNKYEADLVVFVANEKYKSKGYDYVWYFSKQYIKSESTKIYLVNYKYDADVIVYYTNYFSDAQWKKSNKWHGRFK